MSIGLTSADKRRADRAVVFACDANYARYAFFAADQIARRSPGRDFDICLCAMGEDLAPVPGLAGHGFRLCRIETGGVFRGLNLDTRRTEAAYLRLALPATFAEEYERLLYLDSDVFVQGGDFGGLLRLGIAPHAVAAVRDNTQWRTPNRRPEQFRRLGLPTARYFNSGLLLIDVAAFNRDHLLERCIAFARAHAGRMIGHDQNLLNCVLRGCWAELSPVWNWQYTWASRMFESFADPHVVHFIGPKKPWKHAGGEMPLRFRRAYREFFATHFQDGSTVEDGVVPMTNRTFLQRSLAKHLLSAHKMAAYLRRFPTDMTVLT